MSGRESVPDASRSSSAAAPPSAASLAAPPPRAGRFFFGLYLLFLLTIGLSESLATSVENYARIDARSVKEAVERFRALRRDARVPERTAEVDLRPAILRSPSSPATLSLSYDEKNDRFMVMFGYEVGSKEGAGPLLLHLPALLALLALFLWMAPVHFRARAGEASAAKTVERRVVGLPSALLWLCPLAALLRSGAVITLQVRAYGWGAVRESLPLYAVTCLAHATLAAAFALTLLRLYATRRVAWPLFREMGRLETVKEGHSPSLALQFTLTLAALGTLPLLLGLYFPLHFNPGLFAGARETIFENYNVLLPVVMLAAFALVLLPAQLAAAWSFRAGVQKPLDALVSRMDRVAKGDFTCTTTVLSTDEVGALKGHFNRMLAGLSERERMRDTFGRYVSPEIAERIMADGPERLAGAEVEATVLFCDIRDFTPLSEGLPPRELLALLNAYFAAIVEPVRAEGGVVNKFIGDAVMAIFSPVFGTTEHARAACRAALGMRKALAEFNARSGRPPIRFGVGLHTGPLVAGNLGTPERLEYTVIGDTVNIASRVESATKGLSADLLCTAATAEACGAGAGPDGSGGGDAAAPLRFVSAGPADLKGKSGKTDLFRIECGGTSRGTEEGRIEYDGGNANHESGGVPHDF